MSDTERHEGSCHCGKVRFAFTSKVEGAMSCNCSICRRTGGLLTFVPKESFELLSGEGDTKDYQFGKQRIHHLFCTTCGVRSFGRGTGPDGKEMVAINLRCVPDVDLAKLKIKEFDGASM